MRKRIATLCAVWLLAPMPFVQAQSSPDPYGTSTGQQVDCSDPMNALSASCSGQAGQAGTSAQQGYPPQGGAAPGQIPGQISTPSSSMNNRNYVDNGGFGNVPGQPSLYQRGFLNGTPSR